MPIIVPNTLEKFTPDSDMYEQWANILNDHKLRYGSPSNNNIQPALMHISGPDFSTCSSPLKVDVDLTLPEGELPELLVVCQKSHFTLAVGKDFKLWLYVDDDVKETLEVGPCDELFLLFWNWGISWSSPTPCQGT